MEVSVSAYYAFEPKKEDLASVGLRVQIKALFDGVVVVEENQFAVAVAALHGDA